MLKSPTVFSSPVLISLVGANFGQSEVQNLSSSARGNKNVSRLDVTMNDALCVGRVEAIQHLTGNVEASAITQNRPMVIT